MMTKLTLRNLLLNRKRTIVTLVGIILSGAMITGVATIFASFQDAVIRSTKLSAGDYHAVLRGASYGEAGYVMDDVRTEQAMLTRGGGYAYMDSASSEVKPYVQIWEYDALAFRKLGLALKEGRYPERSGELVVSESAAQRSNGVYRVGAAIPFDIGTLPETGSDASAPGGGPPQPPPNALEIHSRVSYTIVGILHNPRLEWSNGPIYAAFTFLDEQALRPDERVDIWFSLNNPNRIYEIAPQFAENTGATQSGYNNELLRWFGVSDRDNVRQMFRTVMLIISLLVMIGSVAVIYNAFAISVSERKKQFGMLASVGATSGQIRAGVFMEGVLLALVGVPAGIAFGTLGIGVTLQQLNRLMILPDMPEEAGFRLIVSLSTIAFAVGFMALTIALSAYLPARWAARVSPIDAIRLASDVQIKGQRLRTSRLTRKLFGVEGELALKHLRRHRKRYRVTVFSLFISIILFVSFHSFMNYGMTGSSMYYGNSGYDIEVQKYNVPKAERDAFYSQVASLGEVRHYAAVRAMRATATGLERSQFGPVHRDRLLDSPEYASAFRHEDGTGSHGIGSNGTGGYRIGVQIAALGDAEFAAFAERLGISAAPFEDAGRIKAIVLNQNMTDFRARTLYEPLAVKAGESLTLTNVRGSNQDGAEQNGAGQNDAGQSDAGQDDAEQSDAGQSDAGQAGAGQSDAGRTGAGRVAVDIGAVTKLYPLGITYSDLYSVNLIVSDAAFDALAAKLLREGEDFVREAGLYLVLEDRSSSAAVTSEITAMAGGEGPGFYVADAASMEEAAKRSELAIAILLYGFVTLITLIGATNIFNTISTNIALRRREFAMLRSVGMTPRGFSKLLNFECLFYGLTALAWGLPVAALLSLWLYNAIGNVFAFEFALPWRAMAYCAAGVFALVFATMLHASARLKRENIIDALRGDNV